MPAADANELARLEQSLRALTPQPANLNRDRLMFTAGADRSRRQRRTWQGLAAATTIIASALGLHTLLHEPAVITNTVTQDRIVYVPVPAAPAPTTTEQRTPSSSPALAVHEASLSPSEVRLLQMQDVILRWGPDALPKPQSLQGPASPPKPIRDLLDSEMSNTTH